MKENSKDVGKKVRIVLQNNIFYSGKILAEDENFLTILDKFNFKVRLNKNQIISLEVKDD